ncbi:hypothetical protein JP39_09590 [Companilactobacillus heilongjiangensis]|uniref:Uncharacterized protein n=1 Tax=Companilactobacillus heilongjiangensis TaxID=1074467 RepID=A0A0K2LEH9_9LACO|nr:hypothetical protein JP39_09590 [Companilactobacillus heilongjiangensis]
MPWIEDSGEGGVTALAVTPRGDFGYLPNLQGFKARGETLARAGPHRRLQSMAASGGLPLLLNNDSKKRHAFQRIF